MEAVSTIFNIVFVPPDYSWIRKARKVKSECLSWADWKRKENLAKFDTIVLEFAALRIATASGRWRTARFEVNSPTL
jgi:hypothetical protein